MNLENPKKVEEVYFEIIKDRIVKEYFSELRMYDVKTYANSINVCFLCLDLGSEFALSHEELTQLAYCAIFHEIGKLNFSSEIFLKEKKTKKEKEIVKEVPRRAFMSLQHLDYHFESKVVVAINEYHKSLEAPRKRIDRRDIRRLDSFERRKFEPKVHVFAQIVAISILFEKYLLYNKNNPDMICREKIEKYLKKEFLGSDNLIKKILERI
ncbi:MAG: hypothetical protein KC589_07245 [Nanoarchaeota archaeon]|nr:hypothetical protein [Nanoarchaeota archaeon]